MSDLLTYCRDRADAMTALIQTLVEYESFSADKPAVDRLADYLAGQFQALGAAVERYPNTTVGDMLLAKWNADAPGKPITFIGHMDTVWPAGTLAERPIRIEDGRLYGPGSIDMKAGLAVMLEAIRVLRARGEFPDRPVWALATGDEEIGSRHSRELIEQVAAQSGLVLIMEPATPEGALKTWRKGIATYTVRTVGRQAHAGGAPEEGINAVVELAHQIIALHRLNDLQNGTSVSVTVVKGGHASNVIPDSAEAQVDVRTLTIEAAGRIDAAVRDLHPVLPGAQVIVEGGESRPPLERDEKMLRAFAQARQIGEAVGVAVREGGSGGASDGNFTAAIGVPTLDGMGPTGAGLHAVHEHVLLSSVPEKVALIAAMLKDWQM
jgi:glutamate carboxypeptidase